MKAERPDETPGRQNKAEALQSDATDGAEKASPIPCSVLVLQKKSSGKVARHDQVDLDVHWNVLARAVKERLINKCAIVMERMRLVTFLKKNVSKRVKNGLQELEELLDRISSYWQT